MLLVIVYSIYYFIFPFFISFVLNRFVKFGFKFRMVRFDGREGSFLIRGKNQSSIFCLFYDRYTKYFEVWVIVGLSFV